MALDISQPIAGLVRDLVDIPSVSHHERALADVVQAAVEGLSLFSVERLGNNVIARTQQGLPSRVILAGHLDTVPADGNEGARDGVDQQGAAAIFGIGACDMKGGVATLLTLMHRAQSAGETTRDVSIVFYECEEVASEHNGLGRIAHERPELLAADMAILAEPSNGGIEAGCQGTLRVRVATTGVRAHTARAWRGVNAIHAAAPILQRLVDYVPRQPVIDGLRFHEGLQAVSIAGGVAGNVVPDACEVVVNYRFAPDRSAEEALAHVREVFGGLDVELVDCAEGALPRTDAPPIAEFLDICRQRGHSAIEPKLGWTDVARFASLGIPAVNFGPGDPTLAHSAGEYVPVSQLESCADVLTAWLTTP